MKVQKRLWRTDKVLPVSMQKKKKSKAALLTEPHCVAALKGLQEERAFVHVCARASALAKSFWTIILNLALSLEGNCPMQEVHQACEECVVCK